MASHDVAPGPNGILGRIWGEVMGIMAPKLRRPYTRCPREGVYPRAWWTARLVLLRKTLTTLTYRVTQVITGHGCFGEYLHRIRKEATARCHHCDASVDSAQHTLEFCPAWARPRRDLIAEIGWDLSPPAILAALLASERGRRAVTSFCEQVMLRKVAAERARVRSSYPERIDRRGRGRRRGHPPVGVKVRY